MRLVLLPGLDGTGALFAPFQAAAPRGLSLSVVPLPVEATDYAGLARAMAAEVSLGPDTVLLAESFSGPLALRVAEHQAPAAVVLVNSFVRAPAAARWSRFVPAPLFALRAPDAALRRWLLGPDASPALLRAFRSALRRVPARVLAARVRALATLDATSHLARLRCPLFYLRGTADRLVSPRSLETIMALAPAMRVCEVPGPHLLLQAEPERAWAALVGMLPMLTGRE